MNTPALLRGREILPIIVALAVSILVGHICALPSAVERAPADHHDSDGPHIASCDATTVKAALACPELTDSAYAVATTVTADRAVPGRNVAPVTLIASRRAPDRSLFLLHATFLI